VLPAGGGGELQDRRVQSERTRQGMPHRIPAHELQREEQRRPLPTFHRSHASDQGPPTVSR
jgi:hypothetical protein